jgi:hypothetical protein
MIVEVWGREAIELKVMPTAWRCKAAAAQGRHCRLARNHSNAGNKKAKPVAEYPRTDLEHIGDGGCNADERFMRFRGAWRALVRSITCQATE